MKSLALFLITIVLTLIGVRLLSTESVGAGLLSLAAAAIVFLIALVINHHEHTRR
jgi:O-antigen/teichoic acid export membrane protein